MTLSAHSADHDQLRTFIINKLGIRVVRVRNEDIERRLPDVLDKLRELLVAGSR